LFFSLQANDDKYDYVEWNLGTIRNSGEKTGSAHNTVQIKLLATLLPTTMTELWVTVGVRYCTTWIWVAQISFEVVQDIPPYVEPLVREHIYHKLFAVLCSSKTKYIKLWMQF
jgi:hypothetical protein